VVVPDKLPGLVARRRKTHSKYRIIKSTLKENEQILAGHTFLPVGFDKIQAELRLKHAVHALDFLLLSQLSGIIRLLLKPCLAMLPRSKCPPFKGTFIGVAAVTFKVQF
jgi:hypothetical protein